MRLIPSIFLPRVKKMRYQAFSTNLDAEESDSSPESDIVARLFNEFSYKVIESMMRYDTSGGLSDYVPLYIQWQHTRFRKPMIYAPLKDLCSTYGIDAGKFKLVTIPIDEASLLRRGGYNAKIIKDRISPYEKITRVALSKLGCIYSLPTYEKYMPLFVSSCIDYMRADFSTGKRSPSRTYLTAAESIDRGSSKELFPCIQLPDCRLFMHVFLKNEWWSSPQKQYEIQKEWMLLKRFSAYRGIVNAERKFSHKESKIISYVLPYYNQRNLYACYTSLTLEQKQAVVADILHGVQTLHNNNIAHMNLKPLNILINIDSQTHKACAALTDFANACILDAEFDIDPWKGGRVLYAAPEMAHFFTLYRKRRERKKELWRTYITKSADIWTLGINFALVLYDINIFEIFNTLRIKYMKKSFGEKHFSSATHSEQCDFFICLQKNEQMQSDYDRMYPEPPNHESFEYQVWRCLRLDCSQRPSIEELFSAYNAKEYEGAAV